MNSCLNKLTLHFSIMELTLILLIMGVPAVLCETDESKLTKCDVRGTLPSAPDATGPKGAQVGSTRRQRIDEECQCKLNVEGARCNRCRPSTFGLSADNTKGCNYCFCSGVTNRCHGAYLFYQPISEPTSLPILFYDNELFSVGTSTMQHDDMEIGYMIPETETNLELVWHLPSFYLGNRARSYGGYLRLIQRFTASSGQTFNGVTIVLLRTNGMELQMYVRPKSLPNNVLNYSIPLRETKWKVRTDNYTAATRADFMKVLLNLTDIFVYAPRFEGLNAVYIKDIRMDSAVEIYSPGLSATRQIEFCDCRKGYSGESCDSCSPGFYRNVTDKSFSVFGECKICPCNKHEESCEMGETGGVMCHCRSGYIGEYCEHVETNYLDPQISVNLRVEPEQQTVPRGAIAKLTCIADYHDPNAIYWPGNKEPSAALEIHLDWIRRDGLPLPRGSTVSSGILTIPNVERDATGTYICRGLDGDGIQFRNAPVSSLLITSPPEIVLSPRNRTVNLGAAPAIVCEATGDQPIKIKWTAVGRDLLPNEQDDGEGVLNFHGIAGVNIGKYVCSATNAAGSVLAAAQVLFGPEECN